MVDTRYEQFNNNRKPLFNNNKLNSGLNINANNNTQSLLEKALLQNWSKRASLPLDIVIFSTAIKLYLIIYKVEASYLFKPNLKLWKKLNYAKKKTQAQKEFNFSTYVSFFFFVANLHSKQTNGCFIYSLWNTSLIIFLYIVQSSTTHQF